MMRSFNRLAIVLSGAILLSPLLWARPGQTQDGKDASKDHQDLPSGEGKDLVAKDCIGCHQLTVVTNQRKSESQWTDTIVEMRNRGANGSDEDMETIIHYLSTNFGPAAAVNVNLVSSADLVAGLSLPRAQADAIVAYRDKNGKYKDLAGLKQVPGVEAAKIDAVKDRIQF